VSQNAEIPSGCDIPEGGLELWFRTDPVLAKARADGVDLWALWANLQRPVEDRIRRHQIALDTFRLFYNAANWPTNLKY